MEIVNGMKESGRDQQSEEGARQPCLLCGRGPFRSSYGARPRQHHCVGRGAQSDELGDMKASVHSSLGEGRWTTP